MAASAPRSGLTVGVVAGEASGDNLGAALIEALRERVPGVRVVGVAGPKMRAAGCEALADADELALMGLTEILRHLPRLVALRRRVRAALLALRPDVFVGIDAPEFNLGLERQLKEAGLRTVQYVSPQVWAWRQGRVRTIGQSTDLVLCLLPFEPKFYAEHGVRALFVGHPLADQFPLEPDRAGARRELGLRRRRHAGRAAAGQPARRSLAARRGFRRRGRLDRTAAPRHPFRRADGDPGGARAFRAGAGRARPRASGSPCSTAVRASRWRRRTSCWSLRARRRSRPCCRSGPWWWRTGSRRPRSSCCATSGSSRCSTSPSRTCCWASAWCRSCCRSRCVPRRSAPPCSPSWMRRAAAATLERRFLDVHRSLRQGGAALAAQAMLELAGRAHDGR